MANRIKENPEKWLEIYRVAGRKGGLIAVEKNRKNSPYIWNNVNFLSKLELKYAKILLKEPIDGVNCNIKINGKIIDFFPQEYDLKYQGKFVEFHPWDNKQSLKEYKEERIKVIKNSEYKNKELIVLTEFGEI